VALGSAIVSALPRTPLLVLLAVLARDAVVDGECAIESKPGAGTRIRARLPLPPRRLKTPNAVVQLNLDTS
jgi:hypothetical protein